ncbi:MAG TPA: polyphosphate polymerase domain-containing protein [Bacteroidia bacterium]|nr:polyphosphate polymerase domain-containing protein [Bacteroidia bacterium]
MKQKIKAILDKFEMITLPEMERVELMTRTDLKFCFNISRLPELLENIKEDYRSLEVAGTRMSRYETLYYDTPGYNLFTDHQNGQLSRYKIRMRKYVESNIKFFEVKCKNNKGKTIKTRVPKNDPTNEITDQSVQLLSDSANMQPENLEPKLWVNYNRITLVNKKDDERITIDIDMDMKDENGVVDFPGLVIVEVKQQRFKETSIVKMLRKLHIREGGSSKYCIAVSKLVPNVKMNNFKPDLRTIQKIINDTDAA